MNHIIHIFNRSTSSSNRSTLLKALVSFIRGLWIFKANLMFACKIRRV